MRRHPEAPWEVKHSKTNRRDVAYIRFGLMECMKSLLDFLHYKCRDIKVTDTYKSTPTSLAMYLNKAEHNDIEQPAGSTKQDP